MAPPKRIRSSIQASDGRNSASTSVTINVIDVNNNPVAVNDSISVNENATAEQTRAASGVLSNDTDSDGDSITLENFRTDPNQEAEIMGFLAHLAREPTAA